FALVLSLRKPTILTSGEERWQRAMRFDASQQPVFPKYIDALWVERPGCDDCDCSWLAEEIAIPPELVDDAGATRAAADGRVVLEPRTVLVAEAIVADHPGEKGWKIGAWLVAESEPQIAAMRALAVRKPFGFVPARTFDARTARFFGIVAEPDADAAAVDPDAELMWRFQNPTRSLLVDIASMLQIDARHAAQRGDGRRAVEDLEAVWGVTEQLLENPSMPTELTAAMDRKWIWEDVRNLVTTWPQAFDGEALDRLEALALAVGEGPVPIGLDFARWELDETLERMFTDDGGGDGRALTVPALHWLDDSYGILGGSREINPTVAFLAGPLVWAVMSTRQEMKALFEAAIAEREAEMKQHPADWKPLAVPPRSLVDPGPTIVAGHAAALRTALARVARGVRERDGARIAIAAERFRRAEGREPTSVVELVPKYLREVPRDPTSGAAMTRLDGSRPTDEIKEVD
ncbi:MAG: hypothetical protein QM516_01350, partial [Limnohabitans sp.]|nr:hypothetical protein [Limnohabitans sp.]